MINTAPKICREHKFYVDEKEFNRIRRKHPGTTYIDCPVCKHLLTLGKLRCTLGAKANRVLLPTYSKVNANTRAAAYMAAPEQALLDPQFACMNQDANSNDIHDGWERNAILLSYLQALYFQICSPVKPIRASQVFYGVTGFARFEINRNQETAWKVGGMAVAITFVPDGINAMKSDFNPANDPGWAVLGKCGFNLNNYLGVTRYINQTQCEFTPRDPAATGAWLLLKPGVIANVLVFARGSQDFGVQISMPGLIGALNAENMNDATIPQPFQDLRPLVGPTY